MTLEAFISFLVSQMKTIRKSHVKTLAALVFGLFKADYIGTAEIGRKMKGMVDGKHKIKRVDRFMGNRRIDILAMAGALFNMLVARLPEKSRLLVALDWTDLHDDKHQTLVLAVISCGRAIPVLWKTAAKDKLKDNQTRIEKELLTDFRTIVPIGTKIVILADRGFGKIDLFEHLKSLNFDYVIRLKRNAYVYNKFYNGSLEKLVIQAGTWRDFGTTLFTAKKRYPLRLITFYDHGQKEPWILTANLKPEELNIEDAVIYYSRRMEIEECFRDIKNERNGLCLRGARYKSPDRYDHVFLVIACGYLFMVLAGQWGEERGFHRGMMANTVKRRTLGLWRVGREIINSPDKYRTRPEALMSKVSKVILVA